MFKKRFETLEVQLEIKNNTENKNLNEEDLGLPIIIIEEILSKLINFENKNKFLSQNISLNELSKSFKTNSTYLSKVINLKKDKNFSQYINDLRVDYSVIKLKDDPKFRKYTIKAIANESGFKNAESFSKAFYKKFGLYPSYYLKKLENKKG